MLCANDVQGGLCANDIQGGLYLMRHFSVFEGGLHRQVANQKSPKSVDSLHKTCNGSTSDLFSAPYRKKKSGLATLD